MRCANCGATFNLDEAGRGECSYCNAALPHAVSALGQDAALKRLLEDRDGDGVPDGVEALAVLQAAKEKQDREAAKRVARPKRLAQLKEKLAASKVASVSIRMLAERCLVVAFALSFPYHFVVVWGLNADPWWGAHHSPFCPAVCDGCSG